MEGRDVYDLVLQCNIIFTGRENYKSSESLEEKIRKHVVRASARFVAASSAPSDCDPRASKRDEGQVW